MDAHGYHPNPEVPPRELLPAEVSFHDTRERARAGISAQPHALFLSCGFLSVIVVYCCCVWTRLLLCVDSVNDAFMVVCC